MSEHVLTVDFPMHVTRGSSGRKQLNAGRRPTPQETHGRVSRVSRLMALAIHFNDLVKRGEVEDFANIARCGHVTRARVSQIVNLSYLAPAIQEEILFLPLTLQGRDPVTERDLRTIARLPSWGAQKLAWQGILQKAALSPIGAKINI